MAGTQGPRGVVGFTPGVTRRARSALRVSGLARGLRFAALSMRALGSGALRHRHLLLVDLFADEDADHDRRDNQHGGDQERTVVARR